MTISWLRAVLLGRSLWSVWLVTYLVGHRTEPLWDVLTVLSQFLLVDGVFAGIGALTIAALLRPAMVWVLPAADCVARLALGGIVAIEPGIPGFPVTATLYLGVVAIVLVYDASTDVVVAIRWRDLLGGLAAHLASFAAAAVLFVTGALLIGAVSTGNGVTSLFIVMSAAQALVLSTAAFERVRPVEEDAALRRPGRERA